MASISNHFIKRITADGYLSEWLYGGTVNEDKDRLQWQYHANAQHVTSPSSQKVMENAPSKQQNGPVQQSGGSIGSTDVPNVATHASKYWPNSMWRLASVCLDMYLNRNPKSQSTAWWFFENPLKPTVEMERSGTTLTYVIDSRDDEMDDDTQYYRTSTRYWLQAITQGSFPAIPSYARSGWTGEFTGEKSDDVDHGVEIKYVASDMPPETPVMVRVAARNEGPSGESEVGYSEVHVFARPNTPTCSIDLASVKGEFVTARINPNVDDWHPIDHIILQRLVASTFDQTSGWDDVTDIEASTGAIRYIDDGQAERIPGEDEATWYRASCWHDEESNQRYGYCERAVLMGKPKKPSVTGTYDSDNDTITANVTVESSMDVTTYCQVVSGSTLVKDWFVIEGGETVLDVKCNPAYAYQLRLKNVCNVVPLDGITRESDEAVSADIKSDSQAAAIGASLGAVTIDSITQNPDGTGLTVSFSWGTEDMGTVSYSEVGTYIEWTSASGGWNSTTTPSNHKLVDGEGASGIVSIDGLEEGTPYSIRLRRYVTVDGKDGYGQAATAVATPQSTPGKPVLKAPVSVEAGGVVRYTWTFSDEGDTPQTEAHLFVNGVMVEPIEGSVGSYAYQTSESDLGTLVAQVMVTTGGGWSELSDSASTVVAQAPSCTASVAGSHTAGGFMGETVTAMPLVLALGGSGDKWRVMVRCAQDGHAANPGGGRSVFAGETIAVDEVHAAGESAIECELVSGAAYVAEVTCIDSATGIESDPVSVGFTVAWANPATLPSGSVEVTGGEAVITPERGEGAAESETCRIWRNTIDGYVLCAEAEWGVEYVDKVPPYGWDGCAYAIESVTSDGDSTWVEVPYEYDNAMLTIDWDLRIELPWNLELKSSYGNEFERRIHMDGSRIGYWRPGSSRDGTASSDILANDYAKVSLLRDLGRHSGICFVRAKGGVAFPAHVEVNLSRGYRDGDMDVDLSCSEVDDDGTWLAEPMAEG